MWDLIVLIPDHCLSFYFPVKLLLRFVQCNYLASKTLKYEGESISNQPIPFAVDRDGHNFHALFQYMFYTRVQNCTLIESFFNKILNVKHG